ncbi:MULTISPECIES: hypothetical protein [unclassified Haloferax]|jgi:hypothetical protein|uniref:hypothetical protein n=1 Tax=unclassified Haloferax TaxID=2625095 RepID=UPI002876CBBF|nr:MULTISPECIES: hypothetical protein [unclassified Haloferax]MDS0243087.1 hypothetical protein [Haloferax sp. S2CR25]MDS0446208.1 hypothetical protein [Haloferax sp. S2CR25-2]
MNFNEPLIRTQQDAQDAYAVDLQARDETEIKAVIEAIDDQLEAMDNSNSLELVHAPQLETLQRTLSNGCEESINALTLVDGLRTLSPEFVIEIDRSEDHTPAEYVWHNGFRFIGISSPHGDTQTDLNLHDYSVERLLHFTNVYPVTFYRIQSEDVPFKAEPTSETDGECHDHDVIKNGPYEECPYCELRGLGVLKLAEFGDHPDVRFSDIRFHGTLAQWCVECDRTIYRHPILENLNGLPGWVFDK